MKKITFYLLFLCLIAISCNKDSDGGNYFRFKINGEEREASGLLAYATRFSDFLTIYGVFDANGNETSYISLPLNITEGDHQLNDGEHIAYYVDANDVAYSTLWGSGSGTVTIESISEKSVKGTFSFNVYDSDTETVKKTVTEGEFNVDFR
ncbi:MAG: hypothetical protein JNJ57_11375 [Saprospiraceae bacterium]|nr:hypothetical protein [Saprospiraceae bacterium]